MKHNFHAEIKRYLREIALFIPNDYPNKKRLLQAIKRNLEIFLEEHPNSSFEDVANEFGTASEVANSFIEELSGASISVSLQKKKRRNHWILMICIAMVCVSLLLCIAMYYFWYTHQNVKMGDTFYIYNGTEITHEEFLELNED